MIAPLDSWSRLRDWLARALRTDPRTTSVRVAIRNGYREEYLVPFPVGEDETADSVFDRITHSLDDFTTEWDHAPKVMVRFFGTGPKGQASINAGSDHGSVNDDRADQPRGGQLSITGDGQPGEEMRDSAFGLSLADMRVHGVSAHLATSAAALPQFSMLSMLEMQHHMMRDYRRTVEQLSSLVRHQADKQGEMVEAVLNARVQAKQAEIEADGERRMRSIEGENQKVKQEMIKMFAGNFSKAMDLAFAHLTGVPPNDPVMIKSFLMGFIRENPDQARAIAADLGFGSAFELPTDPEKLRPMLEDYAKKHPAQAQAVGEQLYETLMKIAEEEESKKKK